MSERFVNYPFLATNGTSPRTQPAREGDIKNVFDFGATGNGGTDDTIALNAALNWTTGPNRGIIFFPPGNYLINSPLSLSYNGPLNINIMGSGAMSTQISCGFSGYIFDRSLGTPSNTGSMVIEKMTLFNGQNSSTGGGIRAGSCATVAVRDCDLSAAIGITTEDTPGGNTSGPITIDNCVFNAPTNTNIPGYGLICGGGATITGSDWHDIDTGIRCYGRGFFMAGGRMEHCNTAIAVGVDGNGVAQGLYGGYITSVTMEGDGTGIDLQGPAFGCYMSAGHQGHNAGNSGYPTGVQNSQYGFRLRDGNAQACTFQLFADSQFDQFAIYAGDMAARGNNTLQNCSGTQVGSPGGAGWRIPSNAYSFLFDECNIDPTWLFSQLASGANVFEGDEFTVTDSGTLSWGASYTGGGTDHALVRWNGSAWTVMAI